MKQRRWKFRASNLLFLAGLAGIAVVVNVIANQLPSSVARLDCTENKIYTISPSTREIFSELKDVIRIKYFVSGEVPSYYRSLREGTVDFIRELQRVGGDRVELEVIDPEAYIKREAARRAAEREEKKKEAEAKGEEYKEEEEFDPMDLYNPMGRKKKLSDEEKVRRDLDRKGIFPIPAQDIVTGSKLELMNFYSAIKIDYRGKPSEVIGPHVDLENLEYELASRVLKLVSDRKPKVAFFDGQPNKEPPKPMNPAQPPQPPPSDYHFLLQILRQHCDVEEIDLTKDDGIRHRNEIKLSWASYETLEEAQKARRKEGDIKWKKEEEWIGRGDPLPGFEAGKGAEELWDRIFAEDTRKIVGPVEREGKFYLFRADENHIRPACLVVAQPRDLNDRQKYEINRYVSEGGNAVFLDGKFQVDMKAGLRVALLDSGLEEIYKAWGLELGRLPVNDVNMASLIMERQVRIRGGGTIRMPAQVQLPPLVVVDALGMDGRSPLTRGFSHAIFPWACGVKVDKTIVETDPKKEETDKPIRLLSELFRSSDQSWHGPGFAMSLLQLSGDDWRERIMAKDFEEPEVLAVHVKGRFPFKYAGKPVPPWPKEAEEEAGTASSVEKEDVGKGGAAEPPPRAVKKAAAPAAEKAAAPPAGKAAAPPAEKPAAPPAEKPAAEKPAAPAAEKPAAEKPAPAKPGAAKATAAKAEEKTEETARITPAEAHVVLVSTPDLVKSVFLQINRNQYRGNFVFLSNVTEAFSLGERLISIRAKTVTPRPLVKGDEWDGEKEFWKWFNILGVPAIVIIIGVVRVLLRKQQAWRYETRFARERQTAAPEGA